MSVMEAAAVGTPAISFRVPGLQDAIADGVTGWLVDDVAELSETITTALHELEDDQVAEEWAARCRTRARRFTWSATAYRFLGILSSEQERLQYLIANRREISDASTIVSLPRGLFSFSLLQRLRRQDQVRFDGGVVELLFCGTDEIGALSALRRVGMSSDQVLALRVARSSDLLEWDFDAAVAGFGYLEDDELSFAHTEDTIHVGDDINSSTQGNHCERNTHYTNNSHRSSL